MYIYLRNSCTPGLLKSWMAVLPNMVPVLPVVDPKIDGLIRCHFGWRSNCWYALKFCKNDFGLISTVLTLLLMLTRFESPCFELAPVGPLIRILYKRNVKKYISSTKLMTEPPRHNPKIPPNEATMIHKSSTLTHRDNYLLKNKSIYLPNKPSHVMYISRRYLMQVRSLKCTFNVVESSKSSLLSLLNHALEDYR